MSFSRSRATAPSHALDPLLRGGVNGAPTGPAACALLYVKAAERTPDRLRFGAGLSGHGQDHRRDSEDH
jgi:hypothetical protein